MVTIVDQNGSKFVAGSVFEAVLRCREYCKPGDAFRIYVYDKENPYPGYVHSWVSMVDDKVKVLHTSGVSGEKIQKLMKIHGIPSSILVTE